MEAYRLNWDLGSETLADTNRKSTPSTLEDFVAELYESQREDVFRYLRSRGVLAADAREICQESFFRLFLALRRGEKIKNSRAWIFTVAHNQGVNRVLASAGQVEQEPDIQLIAPHLDPEQRLIENERLKRLRTAVGSLPAQQKSFLSLRAAGFRYREIADITGVTISTVGESLRRAVTRLRKALYE